MLDTEPLIAVSTITSHNGTYDVMTLAHGATIPRGDHTMQFVVTNVADGTPAAGLTISLVPWMPAMGHGTSIVPSIKPLGNGIYELDNLDLFMPGTWQLRATFTSPDGSVAADAAEPSLQVQ